MYTYGTSLLLQAAIHEIKIAKIVRCRAFAKLKLQKLLGAGAFTKYIRPTKNLICMHTVLHVNHKQKSHLERSQSYPCQIGLQIYTSILLCPNHDKYEIHTGMKYTLVFLIKFHQVNSTYISTYRNI